MNSTGILKRYFGVKLRFRCMMCGACCRRYWVCPTHCDIARISKYGGYNPREFLTLMPKERVGNWNAPSFLVKVGGRVSEYYVVIKKRRDGYCFFNEFRGARVLCKVHSYKPLVCRFYPVVYWVKGTSVFFEVHDDAIGFCPGIGRGSTYDLDYLFGVVLRIREEKRMFFELASKWNEDVSRGRVDPTFDNLISYIYSRGLEVIEYGGNS